MPSMAEEHDVVVFDGWSPQATGRGSFLFHNCHPVLPDLKVGREAETPVLLDWDHVHPLLRFVSLGDVFVLKLPVITPPKWMKALVETTDGPMMLCSEQKSFRVIYLPFHISNASNFSAQGTFPIFVLNALRWLPGRETTRALQFLTGQTLHLAAHGQGKVAITGPDGRKHSLQPESGRVLFAQTERVGVYQVEMPDGKKLPVAVNLLSAKESRIAPQSEFKLKGADVTTETRVAKANRETWHWLVLAAFFLLLFEWYIYNAKVYL